MSFISFPGRSPDVGSGRGRVAVRRTAGWALLGLPAAAAFGYTTWRLLWHARYRIDIDVYRMGGQAWLNNHPLYSNGVMFHTPIGLNLPFTYPPLAAVAFSPFAWLGLPAASAAITLTTLTLLIISILIVLSSLDVWATSRIVPGPAWLRRCWLAVLVTAAAAIWLEPIRSNFAYGQINVVLMTLVIADCMPRRTPWPRGALLGIGIALKLTPAVFLLYFLLRRDTRAALTAVGSSVVATLVGFVMAWDDSWEYWTDTVHKTDRIGSPDLNTNQNIAGVLARLGLDADLRFTLWAAGCLLVLAVTLWAARRMLDAGEPACAVICVALFGLLVSPISWSHHWVWMLPAVLVTTVTAWRRRNAVLALVAATGLAVMVWAPIDLLPKHHESTAAWWRQLVGASYVWWALATLAAAGLATVARSAPQKSTVAEPAPVSALG
jgi:alpha-1,2-mannosyltransferase